MIPGAAATSRPDVIRANLGHSDEPQLDPADQLGRVQTFTDPSPCKKQHIIIYIRDAGECVSCNLDYVTAVIVCMYVYMYVCM